MRVLIVRLSSMGDLVQTLPALTDAARARPGIRFDWVVDESFAQVATWHPNVETVIASAFRRWRREPLSAYRSGEPTAFLKKLRAQKYDLIVDVQCELKSALAARLARGPRHGYDRASVHEWGAQFAYQRKYSVSKQQHSIQRMRELLARALGYSYLAAELDYGIDRARLGAPALALLEPFLVFIHSTSWTSKCWPDAYWRALTERATAAGLGVVLPWGNEAERQRALRIAGANKRAIVLPSLSLTEKAAIIARAAATVGLDTGLSHIAAALDIPSVTIYGATDPARCGALGGRQLHLASDFACVNCHQTTCTHKDAVGTEPACLVGITPQRVWTELQQLLNEVTVYA
ncbi:MAG: lipopolysaccharide heptosyltransferase I [Acidobacteria bacterium]|nr:MAG: lipopolysaccharide heptosyltransferase I [Acidobacteriota bacterium]